MQGGNQRLILSIMSQLHRSLPTFFVSFSQSYHKIKKKERENCKKFCCKIINNFSIIIHFSCPALYLLSSGRSPAPVPSGPARPSAAGPTPSKPPTCGPEPLFCGQKTFFLFNVQKSAVLFLQGPRSFYSYYPISSSVWQAALLFFLPFFWPEAHQNPGPRPPGPAA